MANITNLCVKNNLFFKQVSALNYLNLNNYSYKFAPTVTSACVTLLCTTNHLSCKCRMTQTSIEKMNKNLVH